jgi:DivIVA domain-containing protein
VALDRQSIEKKDFPVGARGYDPEAVDAHLSALAEEVDEFKRTARRRTDTLASSAGEQVRAIVEAAERSAADIQRQAEDEAQEIRQEAASEAGSTREQATQQAREYVSKVSESTQAMLARLDQMEQELGGMIESLRGGATRLASELGELEGGLSDVSGAVTPPRARFEPEVPGETATDSPGVFGGEPTPAADPVSHLVAEFDAQSGPATEPVPEAAEFHQVAGEGGFGHEAGEGGFGQEAGEGGQEHEGGLNHTAGFGHESDEGGLNHAAGFGHENDESGLNHEAGFGHASDEGGFGHDAGGHEQHHGSDDAEGARLIALNMALNGTPREETARYLSENFQLSDAGGLLDEVYASVEG